MSKICSNFAVENEFMTCQNRVTNSHKILILNKIIADLQQVMKINSTVCLSGFESWLSNKKKTSERVSFLFKYHSAYALSCKAKSLAVISILSVSIVILFYLLS